MMKRIWFALFGDDTRNDEKTLEDLALCSVDIESECSSMISKLHARNTYIRLGHSIPDHLIKHLQIDVGIWNRLQESCKLQQLALEKLHSTPYIVDKTKKHNRLMMIVDSICSILYCLYPNYESNRVLCLIELGELGVNVYLENEEVVAKCVVEITDRFPNLVLFNNWK